MAKFRSPNYPAIDLGDAVQRVALLWKRERRTAVPAEVAAKAIGYSGISGPARTALAALKKYGLVDSDDKTVKVSELAVGILHTPGDDSALPYLREAALRPELFQQIHANYRDASDDAIRSYLIAKLNFSDTGAAQAIKTYRATASIAKLNSTEHNPQYAMEDSSMEVTQNNNVSSSKPVATATFDRTSSTIVNPLTSQTFSWPLGPDVTAEVKISGSLLRREHFVWLRKYLELAEQTIAGPERAFPYSYMREKVEEGEAKDVNAIGAKVTDGLFILADFKEDEGVDYCDLASKAWIWSIGRHKKSGDIFASVGTEFYENPEYDCLWLR